MRTRTRISNDSVQSQTVSTSGTSGNTSCVLTANVPLPNDLWAKYPTNEQVRDSRIDVIEVMQDDVTPNYFKKRKAGEILPTNTMLRTVKDTTTEKVSSMQRYMYYRFNPKCNNPRDGYSSATFQIGTRQASVPKGFSPPLYTLNELSSLVDSLKIDAKSKLYTQGMDYLTSASEAHKAIAMLTGLKRNLSNTITHLVNQFYNDLKFGKKRIRFRSVKAVTDALGSYWLEYRYGWRLLYYDFKDIFDYLERRDEEIRLVVGRSTGSTSKTTTSSTGAVTEARASVTVGYPGLYDPSYLGYANPLNTAWDIIPLSFVIDMFFDVQKTILALSAAPASIKELPNSSFVTYRCESVTTIQASKPEARPGFNLLFDNEPVGIELRSTLVRRSLPGSPGLRFPAFAGGPNGYQALDLLALYKPLMNLLVYGKTKP